MFNGIIIITIVIAVIIVLIAIYLLGYTIGKINGFSEACLKQIEEFNRLAMKALKEDDVLSYLGYNNAMLHVISPKEMDYYKNIPSIFKNE
jgi:hypothetical protein